MEKIKVGRIPVHLFSESSLHQKIREIIEAGQKRTILHANAHLVQLANSTDPWIVDYYNKKVDFVMCDGSGIQLGAKITGQKVPEKIAYNIWFWHFAAFCAKNKYAIFLLGAREGVAERAANNLMLRNPGLKVHHHHGYFDKHKDSAGNAELISHVNRIKPQILLVCFGMPVQEKYIMENFERFDVNVIMSGGGALDFFSGDANTAPFVFRKLYLEWFYRLCSDPLRLWKRYLLGNFRFLYYAFKYRNDK